MPIMAISEALDEPIRWNMNETQLLKLDKVVEILYEAAKRYYFSKDEADFEKVKDTFKLLRDNV